MKKLLGIVVLGLLLSGNAYAYVSKKLQQEYIDSGLIKVGMIMSDFYPIVKSIDTLAFVPNYKAGGKYLFLLTSHTANTQVYLAEATNSNPKKNKSAWGTMIGWKLEKYKLIKIYDDPIEAFDHIISLEKDRKGLSRIMKVKATYIKYNQESKIVEIPKEQKPKKKKVTPKQSPDDNKVVAASSGTGFIVSKQGHIITNNHVVDSCNTMKVTFNGNEVDAKTLAVDKMNDIAILKANIKPKSIFPVSNDDVSLLEDVVVAGYPLGKRVSSAIKTHKGVVTALAGAGDNYSNFQTDASINQGNSGGPIMNQKGNIVGIAVATWVQEGVQGVHFGIKSSTLKTFANSNSLKFSSPNYLELSNKDLGKLITDATVYLECHMTVAKIKKIIAEANNRKAFFSEYK